MSSDVDDVGKRQWDLQKVWIRQKEVLHEAQHSLSNSSFVVDRFTG